MTPPLILPPMPAQLSNARPPPFPPSFTFVAAAPTTDFERARRAFVVLAEIIQRALDLAWAMYSTHPDVVARAKRRAAEHDIDGDSFMRLTIATSWMRDENGGRTLAFNRAIEVARVVDETEARRRSALRREVHA